MILLSSRQPFKFLVIRDIPCLLNLHAKLSAWRCMATMEKQPDYTKWSTDELIGRVAALEQQLREQTAKWASSPLSFRLLECKY